MRRLKANIAGVVGIVLLSQFAQPSLAAGAAQSDAARPTALQEFDASVEATKQAMMGDPGVAQKRAEKTLAAAEGLTDNQTVDRKDAIIAKATAQWLLGEAFIGLNEAQKAKAIIEHALAAVERENPDSKLRGDLMRSRATVAEMSGDLQSALRDYLAAHKIFRRVKQPRSEAIALQDIGNLYLEAGDFSRVRTYYSQALDRFDEDPWLNLATFNNRGQAYREQGKLDEAETEYRSALTAAKQLESNLLEARILTNLADAELENGKIGAAAASIAVADRLTLRDEAAGWRPFVLGVRAKIAARQHKDLQAAKLFEAAFSGQQLTLTEMPFRELHHAAYPVYERLGDGKLALAHLKAYQRLDAEALRLTASASSQLLAAQFDFANQNLRISKLKQGQLARDILIERQKSLFRTRLFAGVSASLLVIFGLLSFGYFSIRRSRDRVRAANHELGTTNVALERALKARTDFLATTSHEIRTPLNGILGMAQVLMADRRLATDTRERVGLLLGAGETMKCLVDDILDVAKMETGSVSISMGETHLDRLLQETFRLWKETAASKGLELTCAVDAVPSSVVTDSSRLRQILSNLLSNAIKFTPSGTIAFSATGVTQPDGRYIDFRVTDSGIGIADEDQAMIFEAFTQVNNSTTREFSGTGLGLAISKRLAIALDGDLSVESVVGQGSCFTLRIKVDVLDERLADTGAEFDLATPSKLAEAKLLLIDRDFARHALMRMLLTPETKSVEIVGSVEDAASKLADDHFDHILIEGTALVNEGGAPGDCVRALRTGSNAARITLLAAPSDACDLARLSAAGADQLILKPIGAADLINALKCAYDLEQVPATKEQDASLQRHVA